MLVDEGKLRLGDPVARHLPGFDNDKSRAITIEQLLQHRSGLPLMNMSANPDLKARADAIGTAGPQFAPGEKFWYSDAGSDAAAAIVERISGMTIDQFVAERILSPLGMADSFYLTKFDPMADDPRLGRVASVYVGSPGKWTRFWSPDSPPFYPYAWGSQSLYATTADYARLLAMWMDGGTVGDNRLLSDEAMARILTPTSPMKTLGSDQPYPCGFFGLKPHYGQMSMLYAAGESPARADVRIFGHGGSDGTAAWAFPAEDLIVCYFTQSRGQVSTIRLETTIQDALLQPEGAEPPDDLKPLLGSYLADFEPFNNEPFQIVFRCGKLAVDVPGQLVFELAEPDAQGRRQFVFTDAIAVSFKKDGEGQVSALIVHQGGKSTELPRVKPADAGRPAE
jgi:CubicO group peptidase (beta-lactamase class C family)